MNKNLPNLPPVDELHAVNEPATGSFGIDLKEVSRLQIFVGVHVCPLAASLVGISTARSVLTLLVLQLSCVAHATVRRGGDFADNLAGLSCFINASRGMPRRSASSV
jgi:hypothetical protein